MENEILDDGIQHDHLHVTAESKMYLQEIAKWGKLLAVVGFVFVAFMVIGALSIGSVMGMMADGMGPLTGMTGMISFIYILMAFIYAIPCWHLLKFSNTAKAALASDSSTGLAEALGNLKSVYKFWGIITIIMLVIYGIIFLFGIIGALAM